MPWIESHTALARHPKVLRLARLLGLRVPAALGHLHLLWWWALEYAPSGDLSPFDADEIAIACMWEGETAGLLPALQQAGFLDQDGMLHDWYEYVGRLLEKRCKDVERVQQWREHQKRTPEGTSGERTPPATAAPLERNVDVTRNERVRSAAVHVTYNAPTVPTVPTVLHPPPPPAGAAPAPAREAAVVDTPATGAEASEDGCVYRRGTDSGCGLHAVRCRWPGAQVHTAISAPSRRGLYRDRPRRLWRRLSP